MGWFDDFALMHTYRSKVTNSIILIVYFIIIIA